MERVIPTQSTDSSSNALTQAPSTSLDLGLSDVPPTYTIDLSLPPSQRYVQVASDYKALVSDLTGLFKDIVSEFGFPAGLVTTLARIFLWRLFSKEQTEEIRGISKATGVDMYLLVAFNTLLDLFMGCTSGGVKVKDGKDAKMLHFRTLDWGMDALRKVIVQLEFVKKPGGDVIARTVSYIGFVGVLTGVRKDLSVSLNFRPYHNDDTSRVTNFKFYGHHLLVLLGLRPSISSNLRELVIPKRNASILSKRTAKPLPSLVEIMQDFPAKPTTAAYLIFSDGETTAVMEKDRVTADVRTSKSFIVATNHDASCEGSSKQYVTRAKQHIALGMQDLVDESMDRKACISKKWKSVSRKYMRSHPEGTIDDVYITKENLMDWVEDYPITNEETHFAAILDPKTGDVTWIRRWENTAVPPADGTSSTCSYVHLGAPRED
ncbi:hypothetical protein K432DRAFT_307562 [Lepidopterella palustris CBS 459.81]|uniref:ceramidase n=1 Tax=Lepidopterella palustris CBS 459.81 TaxID=1314670 RepID=A0A8E2E1Y9_9PEZI|nr:hypothetical protein K432DRAFT_307562 [Lepidopterella palustris CBS 459.81]